MNEHKKGPGRPPKLETQEDSAYQPMQERPSPHVEPLRVKPNLTRERIAAVRGEHVAAQMVK